MIKFAETVKMYPEEHFIKKFFCLSLHNLKTARTIAYIFSIIINGKEGEGRETMGNIFLLRFDLIYNGLKTHMNGDIYIRHNLIST